MTMFISIPEPPFCEVNNRICTSQFVTSHSVCSLFRNLHFRAFIP